MISRKQTTIYILYNKQSNLLSSTARNVISLRNRPRFRSTVFRILALCLPVFPYEMLLLTSICCSLLSLKLYAVIPEPTARSAVRRGLLIPLGYLHPGKCEHSEVQSHPPCHGRTTFFVVMRMRESSQISKIWRTTRRANTG